MSKRLAALSALATGLLALGAVGSARADTCDAVKAQIDARIRSNGIANFTLSAVEAAASAPGRVVGNCAGGARKIMMTGGVPAAGGVASAGNGSAPAPAPAPAIISAATRPAQAAQSRPSDNILTECNDGSMSVGGTCKK